MVLSARVCGLEIMWSFIYTFVWMDSNWERMRQAFHGIPPKKILLLKNKLPSNSPLTINLPPLAKYRVYNLQPL
jgi:hypothetical protein